MTYTYTVIATVQSADNAPVDIVWYHGPDLAQAVANMTTAAAKHADPEPALPKSVQYYRTLSVSLHIIEEVGA